MKWGWLTVSAAVVLSGVGVSAGGRALEHSPRFCVSCHEMERPGKGWTVSGAEANHPNCIMCHSGPGPSGVVESQMRGLTMIALHFLNDEDQLKGPFTAKVPDRFCTACHDPVKIEPPHKKLPMAGKACKHCHKHREDWEFTGEIRESDGEG